jgi:hypothetical protein
LPSAQNIAFPIFLFPKHNTKNMNEPLLPQEIVENGLPQPQFVLRRGWRRLRVKAAQEIWFRTTRYYPETRPWWWPFWFRMDAGNGRQISFAEEDQAWRQINILYPQNINHQT